MIRSTRLVALLCAAVSLGCATARSPLAVRETLADRIGHPVPTHAEAGSFEVPEGIALEDGVSEDEAVALALWNSPELHADLAALGVARADFIQAGLLRNPVLSTLFPSGPKQLEATLSWALDAIWERPRRAEAALLEWHRVAEDCVQRGLDRARDVRVAFIRALRARSVAGLSESELEVRVQRDAITSMRLQAGQVTELESMLARTETLVARERAARAERDADKALLELRTAIGAGPEVAAFVVVPDDFTSPVPPTGSELLQTAWDSRPELHAAQLGIEAAARRAGWERRRVLRLTAVLDANDPHGSGFEIGPGVQIELPLFDRNQAGITRAEAQIEDAAWRYVAARRRVGNEVAEAAAAYRFALAARERFREETEPVLERARAVAAESERRGATSHLEVLEVERQRLLTYAQGVLLETEVRMALAELERSLGRTLDARS